MLIMVVRTLWGDRGCKLTGQRIEIGGGDFGVDWFSFRHPPRTLVSPTKKLLSTNPSHTSSPPIFTHPSPIPKLPNPVSYHHFSSSYSRIQPKGRNQDNPRELTPSKSHTAITPTTYLCNFTPSHHPFGPHDKYPLFTPSHYPLNSQPSLQPQSIRPKYKL